MTTTALTDFAHEIESHMQALTRAAREGYRIDKAQDPVEGYREDLTPAEAAEVAAQDPGLILLQRYPVAVAREVAARRPDLAVGDSVSVVLTVDPRLTADEVIAVLDEAVAEASAS